VLSFEGQYQPQDPQYNKPGVKTAAEGLRQRFANALASARGAVQLEVLPRGKAVTQPVSPSPTRDEDADADEEPDVLGSYEEAAIKTFRSDGQFLEKLRHYGTPWRGVEERLKEALPDVLSDRDKIAYGLVPKAMNTVFGQQDAAWKTEKRAAKSGTGFTTWIVIVREASGA
jgi:hypothetical protein